MKKKVILPALLMAASLFAFSGCGSDSSSGKEAEALKPLKEISSDVLNCGVEFPEMVEVIEDNFQAQYRLTSDDYEEYSLWWAGDSCADEVCIIKAKDLKKVKDAVNERLEAQKTACDGYYPAEYDKLCKTKVKTKGDYVYWLCTNDNDKSEKALEADFK